ncbi:MAG: CpaF family protein [Veillonellaceae bacterium]|nr:CpaF family protein [Veillonellaceae bacterium]MCI7236168.1 CpaF family protein [Veillonellaceae bacterium]MDD6563239.1 CpaF family protein [Veillonellaceae bacterium]MDY5053259.1 CpaF family protein [Anaerovibrio sp.]
MTLLEKLGRGDCPNVQVQIFAAISNDVADTAYQSVKKTVHRRLVAEMSPQEQMVLSAVHQDAAQVEQVIGNYVEKVLEENPFAVPVSERSKIVSDLKDEMLGLGPIEVLLKDPTVTEVMVNGPKKIFVERMGRLQLTDIQFHDDSHVMNIIERILSPIGRHIDESVPLVDARLEDGSRVNIIIPPLSLVGPCITIRKFATKALSVDNLITFGTLDRKMADFIKACIQARINILVSGGTGSGKTTTLNVLSSFIPENERIVTIEDAAELKLQQEHVVTLESRPANIEGNGEITIRDLVKNALRMRPDRIIVGEVRGGEALDMLQAMNTGHDGSLTTAHANNPRDALSRLETMVLMAGFEMPIRAIREQVSSAIELILQQSRLKDGSRKITYITEVQHMEGDVITTQDLFRFEQTGMDENGKLTGHFVSTGMQPGFMDKFQVNGVSLPDDFFMAEEEKRGY